MLAQVVMGDEEDVATGLKALQPGLVEKIKLKGVLKF